MKTQLIFFTLSLTLSLAFLDSMSRTKITNVQTCLTRKESDASISCDTHLMFFLEASRSALLEIYEMIDTEKRAASPLVIFPGVQSGRLMFQASSSLSPSSSMNRARLDLQIREGYGSWISATSGKSEYLQISSSKPVKFHAIETKGDLNELKWVSSYSVQYTLDGNSWVMYKNGLSITANSDNTQSVYNELDPFVARTIRIIPQSCYNTNSIRAEVYISDIYYNSQPPQRTPLIAAIQTGFNVQASTVNGPNNNPFRCMLNLRSGTYIGWNSGIADTSQWLMISAPDLVRWHRIDVQGKGNDASTNKVTEFFISYTVDGLLWIDYLEAFGFAAIYDQYSIVSIELVPFIALALRINPNKFTGGVSMRAEAYVSKII